MGLNWLRGGTSERGEEKTFHEEGKERGHSSAFPPFIPSFSHFSPPPSVNKATPASPVNLASVGWL